ncbi:sulfite exporter TauE/SafE family protein [Microbacterium paludicola]|uniref:sulfite exporter TauE/SafE family protein n=1 Tax=Microbacterium paludicola TaxID=300019 RepID=UPI003879D08E
MIDALRSRGPRALLTYAGIGLLTGFLSGLFGVGGGTVIVPLLVMLAAFGQRLASGTSSAAIMPIAAVGVITYAVHGDVDWIAALLLAAGAVVGAQLGTRLLNRLSEPLLRWIFVGFLIVVMVSLFFVIPSRDAELHLTFWSGAALVLTGLVTGVMSGLIGVGGGIVVVPVLILLFGASDLIAKGTSLLMMIPTTISGTIGNIRHKNVDLVAGLGIGVAACVTTPLGALTAGAIDPQLANILFVVFLTLILVQMTQRAIRASRKPKDG